MKRALSYLISCLLVVCGSCLQPLDPEPSSTFDVYPNPARHVAFITFHSFDEPGTLQVIDASGKIILDAYVESNDLTHPVELKGSPNGKCHVFFKTSSSTIEKTFIKSE